MINPKSMIGGGVRPYGNDDGNVSILSPDPLQFTCKGQANREMNITSGRRRQRQRWLVRLLGALIIPARVRGDAAMLLGCSVYYYSSSVHVDEPYNIRYPRTLISCFNDKNMIYVKFQTVPRNRASLRMSLHFPHLTTTTTLNMATKNSSCR